VSRLTLFSVQIVAILSFVQAVVILFTVFALKDFLNDHENNS